MGISHFSAVSSTQSIKTIASTGDDTTLTTQEAVDNGIYEITLTAAKSIIFPTAITGKIVYVKNLTAATHAVTVKVSGQTGVAIAATKAALLYCNGTDFVRLTADA
jgi:hypothetical protein